MTQIDSSPIGVPIVSLETWAMAIASSACIGFTSLVPWLFNLTFFERHDDQAKIEDHHEGSSRMKYLLSFAVGAILGDIFFHLIPESYQSYSLELNYSRDVAHEKVGISIIAGIFMFIIVEMLLENWSNTLVVESIDGLMEKSLSKSTANAQTNKSENPAETESVQIFSKTNLDLNKKFSTSNSKNDIFRDIPDNNNNCNADSDTLNYNVGRKSKVNRAMHDARNDNNNNESANEPFPQPRKRKSSAQLRSKIISDDILLDSNEIVDTVERRVGVTYSGSLDSTSAMKAVDPSGYLNLIANGFDNFTHGLAIGASFLIGPKVGFLTTFVIIVHEIPHEICDYAILVNSGFSRWDAVKAQSSVSLFGIIGTATALYVKSVEALNAKTVWILPFSAGGFLYIALVNLLPEILDKEADLRNMLGQITCVILGILFMAIVAIF